MEKGRIYTSPLFVARVLIEKAPETELFLSPAELASRNSVFPQAGQRNHTPSVSAISARSDRLRTSKKFISGAFNTRISAVASKKVAPTAAMRNKLRRQIYEAVSPLRSSLIPGLSIIIFAKSETIKADFKDLTPDLKNLFIKEKISV